MKSASVRKLYTVGDHFFQDWKELQCFDCIKAGFPLEDHVSAPFRKRGSLVFFVHTTMSPPGNSNFEKITRFDRRNIPENRTRHKFKRTEVSSQPQVDKYSS